MREAGGGIRRVAGRGAVKPGQARPGQSSHAGRGAWLAIDPGPWGLACRAGTSESCRFVRAAAAQCSPYTPPWLP